MFGGGNISFGGPGLFGGNQGIQAAFEALGPQQTSTAGASPWGGLAQRILLQQAQQAQPQQPTFQPVAHAPMAQSRQPRALPVGRGISVNAAANALR